MKKAELKVYSEINGKCKVEFIERTVGYNMKCQHYHEQYEILLITDGERIASFNGLNYLMGPGDLIVIPPFVMHYTTSPGTIGYSRYLLNFTMQDLVTPFSKNEVDLLAGQLKPGLFHLNSTQLSTFTTLLSKMTKLIKMDPPFSTTILRSMIYELCFDIGQLTPKEALSADQNLLGVPSSIREALIYIYDNYRSEVNLEDAASHAGLTKSHFCCTFKKEMGVTFLQYVNDLRASFVHRLLLETDYPLSEIAGLSGFNSVAMMNRVFHDTHHMSPSEYRRKNK